MQNLWKQPNGIIAFEIIIEDTGVYGDPSWELLVMDYKGPYPNWKYSQDLVFINGQLEVDIDRARLTTKDRLRKERAPLLTELDIQFQRALETGSDTTAIVAEKQRLRDITSLADDPNITLEQLANLHC